uniref:Clathrin_bdg domain-containing protein n=1 Tax=Glossina pallidipes TaxID=7398 RepID=A0A1A9ZT53_GLOPL
MVNVPPIPPLLCSTPPPIDSGEEDDDVDISPTLSGVAGGEDYGDFLTVIDIPESLPSPSASLSEMQVLGLYEGRTYIEGNSPPPLKSSEKSGEVLSNERPSPSSEALEALNCNIEIICTEATANTSPDIYEINGNSESNKITFSGTKDEPVATVHSAVILIEDLEDDTSDEELYSPKISKNFAEKDTNINDYYKIQEIDNINENLTAKKSTDFKNINTTEDGLGNEKYMELFSENVFSGSSSLDNNNIERKTYEMEDFGDFDNFEYFKTTLQEPELSTVQTREIKEFVGENDEIVCINNIKDPLVEKNTVENNNQLKVDFSENEHDNGDFGDFDSFPILQNSRESDFNGLNPYNPNPTIDSADKQNSSTHSADNEEDIDFSNFRDIENYKYKEEEQRKCTQFVTRATSSIAETCIVLENKIDKSDDSDDDFGDFNTAQPSTIPAPTVIIPASLKSTSSQSSTLATEASSGSIPSHKNLNERILKILQFMFPEETIAPNTSDNYEQATFKIYKRSDIPFPPIDSAKALDYQWANSETRHIFIKSLGIDSRNILFGENWNPSLPRYAANLSFNPLKPMKTKNSNIAECSTYDDLSSEFKSTDSYNHCNRDKIGFIEDAAEVKVNTSNEQTKEVINPMMLDTSSIATSCSQPVTIIDSNYTAPLQLREEKYSKTPPLSEMETVERFSSPLPSAINAEDSIIHNSESFDPPEISQPTSSLNTNNNENEVIVTSTFSGSFKETHIYTPSKTMDIEGKNSSVTPTSSPSKVIPIDFDYAKAAMGVIIDETVVKKEYRDVVYEPGFSLDVAIEKECVEADQVNSSVATTGRNSPFETQISDEKLPTAVVGNTEDDDEFSDFQSVPSVATDVACSTAVKNPLPFHSDNTLTQKSLNSKSSGETSNLSATTAVHGMILSPAILLPQAIAMENQTPKIEWGDSTANINPEELARIDELFPEPKSLKSTTSSSSQKSTPTREAGSSPSTLSISATVAHKEQQSQHKDDEDDWSDYISVPISNIKSITQNQTSINNNNNNFVKTPNISPLKQLPPANNRECNSNNDDEWSDFVSSVPSAANNIAPLYCSNYRSIPQFNSGAWQNANFYNNPLSLYHKGPINIGNCHQQSPKHHSHSQLNNNNNHNYNPTSTFNNCHIPIQSQQPQPQHPPQQQIHIMQNFSTAPERITTTGGGIRNNQFQVGSAKVAPSIALIPDLGFVAPAIPTHTSFINSLPRPRLNSKK